MIASTQSTVAYMNETAIAGWRALGSQGRLRLLRPVNGGRVFMEARYALLYLAENGTAWEVVESFTSRRTRWNGVTRSAPLPTPAACRGVATACRPVGTR